MAVAKTTAAASLVAAIMTMWLLLLPANAVDFLCNNPCGPYDNPRATGCSDSPQPCPDDTEVPPNDEILQCQGPRLPSWNHDCRLFGVATTATTTINLPPEKVTDEVAGCLPGNQPAVSSTITYSKSISLSVGGSAKFDLKILTSFTSPVLSSIKEFGPGIQAGFTITTTTTFGSGKTYAIPADYGYISWGTFSQKAVEATVDQAVEIIPTDIARTGRVYFHTHGMRVVTPIEDETTRFPDGTLSKEQRQFASVDEFRHLCPTGQLPEYLGGSSTPSPTPSPTVPSPAPSGGQTKSQAIDAALKVVGDGVTAGAISSNIATDLNSRLSAMKRELTNGKDVSALVSATKDFVQHSSATDINNDYKARLDSALSAIITASK